jgi:nucleotide-binding universal stress UspA family protein
VSETYIVGYDGTAASRSAVELTVELAAAEHAEVVAAHAYPRVPGRHGRGASAPADDELHERVREPAARILLGLDVEGVSRRVLACGSPAQALHELAEQEHAALLAIGVTHHTGIGRLLPGSVGAKLLHGAPCPVLAVPAADAPTPIRTVGVAYDGGRESRRALVAAERLARTLHARLVLLSCYEAPAYAGSALQIEADLEPALREAFAREVRDAAGRISGVDVQTRELMGPAGSSIVASARDGIDLLVAGSRAYGPVRSVLVGSVSRHLVDHAPCAVLVVPRAAGGDADREGALGLTAWA